MQALEARFLSNQGRLGAGPSGLFRSFLWARRPYRPCSCWIRPLSSQGPRASRAGFHGYDSDYPVAGKVAANAIYSRLGPRKRCPRGHLFRLRAVSNSSGQSPYLGPPESEERAGP